MIKLSKDKYKILNDLKESNIQEAKSVINLITPGEVFVDSVTEPKIAVVYNQGMEGFYLIGDVADRDYFNSIKDDIYSSLSEYKKSLNEKFIEISSESEIGEARIEELLGSFDNCVQYIYVDTDLSYNKLDSKVISVTRDLDIDQFSNKGFLTRDLLTFWGTMENFYKYGRSKILVKDDLIVSIAYTSHINGNKHGIGIETREEDRNKGYAYRVAYELIRDIKEGGLVPYWDCTNDNLGSVSLAKKLGLIKRSSYKCYWNEIK